MAWYPQTPDPEWFQFLQKGDVLESPCGPRVVREVTRWRGRLHSVSFVIKRCSWTRRCYTVVNRSDLKTNKYKYLGYRVRLDGLISQKIDKAITGREFPDTGYTLYCDQVVGVIPA